MDLTVLLRAEAAGLASSWEYNTELFEAATIARLAGHFQTLLVGLVAEPSRRVGELPLLSEAEQQQLLYSWNATEVGYPREASIQQLFEVQVARTPDAVALVFDAGTTGSADACSESLLGVCVGCEGAATGVPTTRGLQLSERSSKGSML